MSRRWMDPESAADIGKLDPEAIARVREEAWPEAASADELHDALLLADVPDGGGSRSAKPAWPALVHDLTHAATCARALDTLLRSRPNACRCCKAVFPDAHLRARCRRACHAASKEWDRDEALREIVRGRLEGLGPTTRRRARRLAGRGLVRRRRRAARAGSRRLRDARQLRAATVGIARSVVRSPAARAHSPLHRQTSARRDRAGAGARLPALPVRLAARHAERRACRGRMQCRRCSVSSKASMRPRAPGKPKSCRHASPSTTRHGSTSNVLPVASCGRGWQRALAMQSAAQRRCVRRRSRCCARRNVRLWSSFAERPRDAAAHAEGAGSR